ncbi:hypothetical protein [Rhizobium etli]|uniref:Uncharacterized protein n=1 Tax=Rhizobium etli TaxID=29449 RepID=A0A7W7EG29_RHIET|nr:hypothetical protein [Rhizobium etli]MBB4481186.1 hypothetical protein [Rhizobium etli]MBB4537199.1 hypothetical protein [Rhizobium etli]
MLRRRDGDKAEAARMVSAKYATEKNAGSARHYEELAETLEQQND